MTESTMNSMGIAPARLSIEPTSAAWQGDGTVDKEKTLRLIDASLNSFHAKFFAFLKEPVEDTAIELCLECREAWSFFWSGWEDHLESRPGGAELFSEGIAAACSQINAIAPMTPELEHVLLSMGEKIDFIGALVERHDAQWVRERMAA